MSGCLHLHDIEDAERFVTAAIHRLGLALSHHDREDLEARGVDIMLHLAEDYAGTGTFAGYAGGLIDRRLLSAWHKQQGHRRTRDANGRRGWDYRGVESLEAVMAAPAFRESQVTGWAGFERPRDALAA